jgi:hypothetical protein
VRNLFRIAGILCLIIPIRPDFILAQEQRNNILSLSFGSCGLHVLDRIGSPLIFRSIGITPDLQYSHKNEKSIQFAEASYSHNNLKASQDNFNALSNGGRIRFSYMRHAFSIKMPKHNLNIFFGGSANSFFIRTDYNYKIDYNSTTARAITSWYWTHSLDLCAGLEYDTGPVSFISAQFYIPLISNVSRPTYSSSGDYNYTTNQRDIKLLGKTMGFPENLSFDAIINYQKQITPKLNLQVGYEFYFADYINPRTIRLYLSNIRCGLGYRF